MVVAGEKESARFLVLEPRQQSIGEFDGEVQVVLAECGLKHIKQCREQEGMVVEICVQMRLAALARRQQFSLVP